MLDRVGFHERIAEYGDARCRASRFRALTIPPALGVVGDAYRLGDVGRVARVRLERPSPDRMGHPILLGPIDGYDAADVPFGRGGDQAHAGHCDARQGNPVEASRSARRRVKHRLSGSG